MSVFITFEGGEGSGKSTQTRTLKRKLEAIGLRAVLEHEPGGTPLGRLVSKWLKWGGKTEPVPELLLFGAARAQLVAEVVKPALAKGEVVILDRFADSTVAYQGYGRGLDLDQIQIVNHLATQGTWPDLVVLLDLDVKQGLSRKDAEKHDRFEQEELGFHRRVREGYLKLAKDDPERWYVVDAALPRAEISRLIWKRVEPLLKSRGML